MTRSLFSDQYDRLCRLLIQARVDAGYSQAQLAKCLRRPQSFVSKYETKQRRLDVVEFLEVAHCMHVSGADLLVRLTNGAPHPTPQMPPDHSAVPTAKPTEASDGAAGSIKGPQSKPETPARRIARAPHRKP